MTDLVLCNARLLKRSGLYDVTVKDGVIHKVEPANGLPVALNPLSMLSVETNEGTFDLAGRLLLPGLVDIHTHLDKALTLPFTQNPAGTLSGAIAGFEAYEPKMTSESVCERTLQTAKWALAHGTTTIRTHINYGADGVLFQKSLEGLKEARQKLQGLVDLQVVLMCPIEMQDSTLDLLERGAAEELVAIGGASHLSSSPRENLAWLVQLAKHFGLTADVHIDEQLNPDARTLLDLTELVQGWEAPLPVVAGHCVSLDVIPSGEARDIAKRVADAGIGVVALPGSNLFLQGREDDAGVRRGVTRVKLLQSFGVPVAAASDNIQDVFHPYGRGDLLEAALLVAYAAHFRPEDAETALAMVSQVPGRLAVNPEYGVSPGQAADLVVLDSTDAMDALQTMAPSRWVFKNGRCVAVTTSTSSIAPI